MKTIGIILLLIGFLATIISGFQITTRDLADLAPEEINNPDTFSLYWSPITAIALLAVGAIVLLLTRKEKRTSHR